MKRISLLVLVLAFSAALAALFFGGPMTVQSDDWEGFVECEYCGELVAEWGLCGNCGGCNYECNADCYEAHHCGGCFSCLVSGDPSSYCEECCLCSDCWDEDIHCINCFSCGEDVCQVCGLCNTCAEIIDYVCFSCGTNHLCENACPNLDENAIPHCTDCCVICEGCGECWHSRGGYELCETCGRCPECCEDEEYHCPVCGSCYDEVERCESGAPHCSECCDAFGYVCESCGNCFFEDQDSFCEDCGMCIDCAVENELHCKECLIAHIECEDCGLCIDCALDNEKHCAECGRCYETVGYCHEGGDHCEECCEENGWICPGCEECTEATGNELCDLCGLCSQCCLANSEAAGIPDGRCVYDQTAEGHEDLYVCEQCGQEKYPTEMCQYCWLCTDCCLDNSAADGCICGMCINDPAYKGHVCGLTVSHASIIGVRLPEEGTLKTTDGITVDPSDGGVYSLVSVKWVAKEEDQSLFTGYKDPKFQKGYAYALKITLAAKKGYIFGSRVEVSLNNGEGSLCTGYVSEEGKKITLTVYAGYIPGDKDIPELRVEPDVYPELGASISTGVTVSKSGSYSLHSALWSAYLYKDFTGGMLWKQGEFFGGRYWAIYMIFDVAEGFKFGDKTAVYVNGHLADEGDVKISGLDNGKYVVEVILCYIDDPEKNIANITIDGIRPIKEGEAMMKAGDVKVPDEDKDKYEIARLGYIRRDKTGYGYYETAGKFEKGYSYTLSITLRSIGDHEFSENTVAYVNGKEVSVANGGAKLGWDSRGRCNYIYLELPMGYIGTAERISDCNITGLIRPEEGEPLQLSGLKASENVEIIGFTWEREEQEGYELCSTYEFYHALPYRVKIRVAAKPGYEFSGTRFAINGMECHEVSYTGSEATLTAVFDASTAVTSIDNVNILGFEMPAPRETIKTHKKSILESGLKYNCSGFERTKECVYILKSLDGQNYGLIDESKDKKFVAGTCYGIRFVFEILEGYTVPADAKAFLQGAPADTVRVETKDGKEYLTVEKYFGVLEDQITPISTVNVLVSAPQAGNYTAICSVTGELKSFRIVSFEWYESEDGKTYKPFGDTFKENAYYKIIIHLSANEGRCFTDFTRFAVNGTGNIGVSVKSGEAVLEKVFFTEAAGGDETYEFAIKAFPTVREYKVGDHLDLGGLVVETFENGKWNIYKNGEGVTVSPYYLMEEGDEVKITVSRGANKDSFTVKVTPEVVTEDTILGIDIVSAPSKTNYIVGDILDTKGLRIKVLRTSGEEEISNTKEMFISPALLSTEGAQEIVVNYKGFKAGFTVTVNPDMLVKVLSLTIDRLPARTAFIVGEKISLEGLAVSVDTNAGKLYFFDGKGVDAEIPETDAPGTRNVVISYGGKSAEFEVTVKEAAPHEHLPGELIPGTEPTCLKTGLKAHYVCTDCGRLLDEELTPVKYSELVIPATGHKVSEKWFHNEFCHWKECTVCGARVSELYLHTAKGMSEADENELLKCDVCGREFKVNDLVQNKWVYPGVNWPVVIAVIAVILVVLASAAVAVIIIIRKKKSK